MHLLIHDLTLTNVSNGTNLIMATMPKGSTEFFESWTKNVFAARNNAKKTAKLRKTAFLVKDGETYTSAISRREFRVLPQYIEPSKGVIALAKA